MPIMPIDNYYYSKELQISAHWGLTFFCNLGHDDETISDSKDLYWSAGDHGDVSHKERHHKLWSITFEWMIQNPKCEAEYYVI